MQHNEALKRLRALFLRKPDAEIDTDILSGPTLLQQEPDLARENARYSASVSAWSASGHSTD